MERSPPLALILPFHLSDKNIIKKFKTMYNYWLRKGILFFITLLLTNFSMAQKNHLSFSMNGIGNNNYLLKESANKHFHLESGFFIHPGGEFLYSIDCSRLFTFHTGVSYNYRQYYIDSRDLYFRYGELAIPAVISLHILKKNILKLDWSSGIYFNQLLHLVWFQNSSGIWYDERHWINSKNPTKFGMDIYSDVKLKYPISKGREIFMAPFWKYHLIEKDYYEGLTSHSIGLKIGYTFKSF